MGGRMERHQRGWKGQLVKGTHRYPGWQLMASFSAGSKWVTMDQHPLKFKLNKDSRQSVQVLLENRNRSFKRKVNW